MTDYPDFDEALRRFQTFVAMQGAHECIVFVTPEKILFTGGRARARLPEVTESLVRACATYQHAVNNCCGVLMAGLCRVNGQLCSYIYGPTSEEEAISLMYPDGLKLSLQSPLPEGYAIGKLWWWILRAMERRRLEMLMKKQEILK